MGFVPPGGLARFCVLSVVAALGTATELQGIVGGFKIASADKRRGA